MKAIIKSLSQSLSQLVSFITVFKETNGEPPEALPNAIGSVLASVEYLCSLCPEEDFVEFPAIRNKVIMDRETVKMSIPILKLALQYLKSGDRNLGWTQLLDAVTAVSEGTVKFLTTVEKSSLVIENRDYFLAKLEEKNKEKANVEKSEIENWKKQKVSAESISKFSELEMKKKLGDGCDGIVFLCSGKGIGEVALKVIVNMGVSTNSVLQNFYNNEFAILKSIPFHKNIIPILKEFHDRPNNSFFIEFPLALQELSSNLNGTKRMTTCLIMPNLRCFHKYIQENYSSITYAQKLEFISDILDGLLFLYDNDVVHLDMKLNNLLINETGRIIISDFGYAKKLNPQKRSYLPLFGSVGGNVAHLAPEIKIINTSNGPCWADYAKQPSFELGMLAHEIIFGEQPEGIFGEDMDDEYFQSLCPDLLLKDTPLFPWLRSLLLRNKEERVGLFDCKTLFDQIVEEYRLMHFIDNFNPLFEGN